MTTTHTVIDKTTGCPLRHILCPSGEIDLFYDESAESVVEGVAIESKQYFVNGVVVDRPTNPALTNTLVVFADGQNIASIYNVPPGAKVHLAGSVYAVDDGIFEATFDIPGRYTIKVEARPYLDAEFVVEAVDAD